MKIWFALKSFIASRSLVYVQFCNFSNGSLIANIGFDITLNNLVAICNQHFRQRRLKKHSLLSVVLICWIGVYRCIDIDLFNLAKELFIFRETACDPFFFLYTAIWEQDLHVFLFKFGYIWYRQVWRINVKIWTFW